MQKDVLNYAKVCYHITHFFVIILLIQQSPEALFRAYVAMEMVAWRLQHSHGEEVIFKDQDLFSKILKLELNTLHDNKKFPTDERDNTGRLIGIFLGRKWNCIQLFIEAGHVTVDVDDTLQSCIHELSLVSDVHSQLILDCAALLVRKVICLSFKFLRVVPF